MAALQKPHRVYLHVGAPKTGTTFLQASLARNRKALRESGYLYPSHGEDVMFRSALDVLGSHKAWGRARSDVKGTWDWLCTKARQHEGTTVMGHELLGAASTRQVASARSMLTGLDVHVVVTARDPARQLVAEWQEGVKHGRSASFEEFSSKILSGGREHPRAQRFWAAQDIPDVLDRWTSRLPAENVHVVCCPPPGADPGELWRRFGAAVGIADGTFDPADETAANSTLGVVQIDLLRRINEVLRGRLVQPEYGRVVKWYFTKQLLAEHHSSPPELPIEMYDGLVHVAQGWVKDIDRAGYTVHGTLAELVPARPADPGPHPDAFDPTAEVTTAAAVIAELLVEVDRLRTEVTVLESDKKSLKKKRKRLKERLGKARGK